MKAKAPAPTGSGKWRSRRGVKRERPGPESATVATGRVEPERQRRAALLGHRPGRTYCATPTVQPMRGSVGQSELSEYTSSNAGSSSLSEIAASYRASLDKGLGLRGQGLDWYGERASGRTPETEKPWQATEGAVAARQYKDWWFFDDEHTVVVMTSRGDYVSKIDGGEVGGYQIASGVNGDDDVLYTNSFDLESGTFHASINNREADQEMAEEEKLPPALPNSEIIFHQYRLARREYERRREKSGGPAPATLKRVSREQISNDQTLDTIFLTDEGAKAFQGQRVTIDDPWKDDAWALLGSPNGRSSIWLLTQHGHDFDGIDIEKVDYSKDNLVIHYVTG